MKIMFLIIFLCSCSTREMVPITVRPGTTVCKGTKMVGWENPGNMNSIDKWQYGQAKRRCKQKHKKFPCLTEFEKVRENTYRAWCGEPKYKS